MGRMPGRGVQEKMRGNYRSDEWPAKLLAEGDTEGCNQIVECRGKKEETRAFLVCKVRGGGGSGSRGKLDSLYSGLEAATSERYRTRKNARRQSDVAARKRKS